VGATFVGKSPKKNNGIIQNIEIFVKGLRDKGIGHKLLGKAHSYLHKKGIKASTTTAIRGTSGFYKSAGYRELEKIGPVGDHFFSKMVRVPKRKQRIIRRRRK